MKLIGFRDIYQVAVELAFHDFFIVLHERHGNVVYNVLESLSANTAEEVAEVATVFLVFLVDIYFGTAEVAEHVAHVAEGKNPEFNGIFHVEDGIADIVGGFHQVNERVAHPLAVIYLREPERFGGNPVEVRLRREQTGDPRDSANCFANSYWNPMGSPR